MSLSGKFVLRTGEELHKKIKNLARDKGSSINEICIQVLKKSLSNQSSSNNETLNEDIPQKQIITIVSKKLTEKYQDKFVGLILFGSSTTCDTFDNSDIDILIVFDKSLSISRKLYTFWEEEVANELKELLTQKESSPHFSHIPESVESASSLWLEISINGIILWERNNQLRRFLTNLRLYISSGAIVRKLTHSQPYWIKTSQ